MSVEVTPRGTRGGGFPRFARALMGFTRGLMVGMYRRRGNAMRINGQPLILLTTVGARSGRRRQVLLSRFTDAQSSGGWLVTATAGGAAAHPAWFINMARNPDNVWVEIDGREMRVRPESLRGAERDEAWGRIVELAPSFGPYKTKTDRQIPVVRLSPIEGAQS